MPSVELGDGALSYEITGSGPSVVLIPGLGATGASFRAITPALSGSFQVVCPDLRGTGASSSAPVYSMEGWAQDIETMMDALGLEQAHIVGSSLGGCVALTLADRAPHRVRSLVLAATVSEIDPLLELHYRVRMALVEQTGMGALFIDYVTALLFGRSFLATPVGRMVAAQAAAGLRRNDPKTYLAHLRALLRFGRCEPDQADDAPFTDRLGGIERPALVMCGDEDILTAPRFSQVLAERLPRAELAILPACGHATFAEQPEASLRRMLPFLQAAA